MRLLIIIASFWALVASKPEMYREKEDFQYSRSSTDEGTKSGFYGAQRGNMGGNYERAHNMDSLAQHQMSTLVRNVDGELGEGAKMRTGSVFSAANSRGLYGSGHYDLSNLRGRNFGENYLGYSGYSDFDSLYSAANNARYSNSQSQSSGHSSGYQTSGSHASGLSSAYQTSGLQNSGLRTGYQTSGLQSSGLGSGYQTTGSHTSGLDSGYQNSGASKYLQTGAQHGVDSTYDASNYEYDSQSGNNYKYTQSSSLAGSDSENSNRDNGYDYRTSTRLVHATPVRVYITPGSRVAIPVAAQVYDASAVQGQNAVNTDSEILSTSGQRINYKPVNNAKHYESSYSYRKEWQKQDSIPAVVVPTESPFPTNSELYEAQSLQTANNEHESELASASSQSSRANSAYSSGYSANTKAASSSQSYNSGVSASNAYTQNSYGTGAAANLYGSHISDGTLNSNNLVEEIASKPKSYHSSYSYHKSWERRGDPYVIKPVGDVTEQNSRIRRSLDTNKYQQSENLNDGQEDMGQQSMSGWEQDILGQQTDGRWQNLADPGQETQNKWDDLESFNQQAQSQLGNLEDLGQQTQNQWDTLENLGQETQNQWGQSEDLSQQSQTQDKLEELGQQTQNQWGQLEDLGQHAQSKLEDLGQQTQNQWDKLENLGQQTQNQWGKLEELGQQTQSKLEDLGQQTQNQWDKLENLGQQTQNQWGKLEDLSQQAQSNLDDLGQQTQSKLEDLGQQTQNQWGKLEDLGQKAQSKLEDLGQQTQNQWGKLEDLSQQAQSNLEDLGQQTQNQWDKLQNLDQQSQNHEDQSEDLSQQSQNQWNKLEDLSQKPQTQDKLQDVSQQSQSPWSKLEDLSQKPQAQDQLSNLGQQTQSHWGQLENFGQNTQSHWNNIGDLSQQTQPQWGQFDDLGQHSQSPWGKLEDLGQQTQNQWNDWAELNQQSQHQHHHHHHEHKFEDFGQQTQSHWNQFGGLDQNTQNMWNNLNKQENFGQHTWNEANFGHETQGYMGNNYGGHQFYRPWTMHERFVPVINHGYIPHSPHYHPQDGNRWICHFPKDYFLGKPNFNNDGTQTATDNLDSSFNTNPINHPGIPTDNTPQNGEKLLPKDDTNTQSESTTVKYVNEQDKTPGTTTKVNEVQVKSTTEANRDPIDIGRGDIGPEESAIETSINEKKPEIESLSLTKDQRDLSVEPLNLSVTGIDQQNEANKQKVWNDVITIMEPIITSTVKPTPNIDNKETLTVELESIGQQKQTQSFDQQNMINNLVPIEKEPIEEQQITQHFNNFEQQNWGQETQSFGQQNMEQSLEPIEEQKITQHVEPCVQQVIEHHLEPIEKLKPIQNLEPTVPNIEQPSKPLEEQEITHQINNFDQQTWGQETQSFDQQNLEQYLQPFAQEYFGQQLEPLEKQNIEQLQTLNNAQSQNFDQKSSRQLDMPEKLPASVISQDDIGHVQVPTDKNIEQYSEATTVKPHPQTYEQEQNKEPLKNTEVPSTPVEPTTEKPGFWGSVWNKTKSAKNSIVSWFSS